MNDDKLLNELYNTVYGWDYLRGMDIPQYLLDELRENLKRALDGYWIECVEKREGSK